MTDTPMMQIICDHGGGRLLPPDHRAGRGKVVIDRWRQENPWCWSSVTEENVTTPHRLNAARQHERTVVMWGNAGAPKASRMVDGSGHVRLRGGITETKRGYVLECPACPTAVKIRHARMMEAFEVRAAAGHSEITLAQLDTPAPASPAAIS